MSSSGFAPPRGDNTTRAAWRAPALLAFVAGFADASTFVGAGRIFCTHMTGNLVILAADLARGVRSEDWLKLAVFPIFIVSVFVVRLIDRRRSETERPISRALLRANVILLAVAATLGTIGDARSPGTMQIAVVVLMAIAMAIQNAFHCVTPEASQATTVMTTNLSKAIMGWGSSRTSHGVTQGPGPPMLALVVLGFVIGCAAGAIGVSRYGFVVTWVPALLTLHVSERVLRPRALIQSS
jgi:uncharacterized membrane protein YoaK (UPF0700 family)